MKGHARVCCRFRLVLSLRNIILDNPTLNPIHAVTVTMAQTFPLMKLPPELRNCVYEAVVASERTSLKKQEFPGLLRSGDQSQPFTSSSRMLLANKEVSCEYNAVLTRLVLDPKATYIVFEEVWVDMSPLWILKMRIRLSSPKNRCFIMSKLKLRVVITGSDVFVCNLYDNQKHLQSWIHFCSMYGITAEYGVSGGKSKIAEFWEFLDRNRKEYESRGAQKGREFAKILRALEDASGQGASSPVELTV